MEYVMTAVFLPLMVIVILSVFCLSGKNRKTNDEYFKSFWGNKSGQDLIEYGLMAGFVAVACGAIVPDVAARIKVIFLKACTAVDGVAYEATTPTDATSWRIACAILAVVFIGLIIVRRRHHYEDEGDKGGHW